MAFGRLLAGSLTALLAASSAQAGQILKFWEEGTRKGKAYQSSITMRSAPEGLRVDVTETEEGGSPEPFSILYLPREDRIAPVEPTKGPAISASVLADLDARAKASGHSRKPGRFVLTPLHTTHVVGKWTASAWALKRPGQPTELLYFAEPHAVGIDDSTASNLKRMGDLFVPFINKMKLIKGEDLRESFNAYGLAQGFPVREFRASGGVVEMDMQLVSIENADLPATLFTPPAPAARDTGPAPDRSLSPEAYVARGMPAPDRSWTGEEYARAAEVLQAVAADDANRLPRLASPASGAVFGRLVSPENLGLTRSTSLDGRQRLQIAGGLALGVAKILGLYVSAFQKGTGLDTEVAELMSFTLEVTRRVATQAEEFWAAQPPGDRDSTARAEGRRKMRDGLATVVSGTLDALTEGEGLSLPARLRVARALEENLPAMHPVLPAGMQQELPVRLRRMRDEVKDPALRESLGRMQASLARGQRKTAA